VLSILREHYADFEPTLAAEKLRTRHKMILAKETVRRIRIASGLWLPRKLRSRRIQQPRMRRTCIGGLIQIADCLLSHVGSSSQAGVYPAAVGLSSERRRVRRWCTSTMRPVV